jgi:hypothetical protein
VEAAHFRTYHTVIQTQQQYIDGTARATLCCTSLVAYALNDSAWGVGQPMWRHCEYVTK